MTEISLSEFANRSQTTPKRPAGLSRAGLMVGAALVIAGISFFSGIEYQKGKASVTTNAQDTSSNQNGRESGGFGNSFRRGDRAIGTVTAVSSSSITIQTRSGSTKTYTITSSTTVMDSDQSSSVSNIQTGDTVFLTLDSSNTQDISSIMLNPSFGGGFGGPSNSGSSTNTSNV